MRKWTRRVISGGNLGFLTVLAFVALGADVSLPMALGTVAVSIACALLIP